MSNTDLISRADALAVARYSKDPVEGIENLPSVDAVAVVRCYECKDRHSSEFCECRPDMAFCSDGERVN